MRISLTLAQKAFLLIGIPLLFELCFVTALVTSLRQLEGEYTEETVARDVLMAVNGELKSVLQCAGSAAAFQVDKDQEHMRHFRRGIEELRKERQSLSELANQDQMAELVVFNRIIDEVIDTFTQIDSLLQTHDEIDQMRSMLRAQKLLKALSDSGTKVLQQQEIANQRQRVQKSRLRNKVEAIVLIGVGLSIGIAAFLALYFNIGTARRLDVLKENALSLALEKPLRPALEGSDEIAALDGTFHAVATALTEAHRREKALTEYAIDVICSLDGKARFTKINPSVHEAWGYEAQELVGRSLFTLLNEADIGRAKDCLDKTATGARTPFETPILRKDQTVCDTSWSIQWSDAEKAFFAVVHDISERKRAQRLRENVTAMISHDLRTPLTSIRTSFELLKTGILGNLNAKGEGTVDRCAAEVDRLVSMINDLLDLDKLDSGVFELEYKQMPAAQLIKYCIGALQAQADAKKVLLLAHGTEEIVWCDPDRITRVIVNLLDNAIKYSHAGAYVEVKVTPSSSMLRFSISDQGRGIPQDKLSSVFERYKQVERADEFEKRGSGLGLAICKAVIEAHKGSIGVESEPGSGSTFWFELPNGPAQAV
jgi:PAS domain S-box-containing protein